MLTKAPRRGITIKDKIKGYFDILSFLKGNGPQMPKEIEDKLGISESSFFERIKPLVDWGWAKHLEEGRFKGRYALYDYVEYEIPIKEALSKLEITEKGYVDNKIVWAVAHLIHANHKDNKFKESFDNVMREWSLSWMEPDSSTSPESPYS